MYTVSTINSAIEINKALLHKWNVLLIGPWKQNLTTRCRVNWLFEAGIMIKKDLEMWQSVYNPGMANNRNNLIGLSGVDL